MAKVSRPNFAVFLNTGTVAAPVFNLCGVYTSDLSISFNPETEETGDVTSVITSKSVTSYAPSFDVETNVVAATGQKGFVLSNFIEELQEKLATAGDAEAEVLLVKLYKDGTVEDSKFGQKFSCNLSFSSLGGSYDESLKMSYTVDLTGEPIDGSVIITKDALGDSTAAFTADSAG